MLKPDEVGHVILAIVVLALVASFGSYVQHDFSLGFIAFFLFLLFGAIVVLVNVFTKKIVAYVLDSEVEMKTWMWQRYGVYTKSYLKKPVPLGFLLPLLLSLITLGYVKFFGFLEYEVYASKSRASKRIGNVRFSELTETHIGAVGAFGILANLVLGLAAYLLALPDLARFSAYFAFANILPLSKLDGVKIFFGSRVAWFVLAILSALALVLTMTVA